VKSRIDTPAQTTRPRFADSPLPTISTNTKATPSSKGKDKARAITLSPTPESNWSSPNISNSGKWAQNPVKRALEVAGKSIDPKKAILMSVSEPEYACHDIEIRDALWDVTELMESFVSDHFGFVLEGKLMSAFFKQFSQETTKVIGCVASGGPGGVAGWHELFIDPVKRKALAMAIIGNVLTEQVFQHIFFGGQERHVRDMTYLQKTHKDEDGKVACTSEGTNANMMNQDSREMNSMPCVRLGSSRVTTPLIYPATLRITSIASWASSTRTSNLS
jgi:hypothetical protein